MKCLFSVEFIRQAFRDMISGAEKIETIPAVNPKPHAAFFRQSGWLMIANIGSGAMMWAVHFLAKKTTAAEYGAFGVMLAVAMCVPNLPLQMVFAQQTARALATTFQPLTAKSRAVASPTPLEAPVIRTVFMLMGGSYELSY